MSDRVSSSGGTGGDPPHYPKNWLVPPCPPTVLTPKCPKMPQNADFAIFMQFLAILPKLSPPPVDPIWETLSEVNFLERFSQIFLQFPVNRTQSLNFLFEGKSYKLHKNFYYTTNRQLLSEESCNYM